MERQGMPMACCGVLVLSLQYHSVSVLAGQAVFARVLTRISSSRSYVSGLAHVRRAVN